MLVVHVLVESVSVLDEHAALTEEAQQDVGGPGTHHLSSNTLSSYSQTSTSEVSNETKITSIVQILICRVKFHIIPT